MNEREARDHLRPLGNVHVLSPESDRAFRLDDRRMETDPEWSARLAATRPMGLLEAVLVAKLWIDGHEPPDHERTAAAFHSLLGLIEMLEVCGRIEVVRWDG